MELTELIRLRHRIEEALTTTSLTTETSTIQHVVMTLKAMEDRYEGSIEPLVTLSLEQLNHLLKPIHLTLNAMSKERQSEVYRSVSEAYLALCSKIIVLLTQNIEHFLTHDANFVRPLRQDLKPSRSWSGFFESKTQNVIHAYLNRLKTQLSLLKEDIDQSRSASTQPFMLRLLLPAFTNVLEVLNELHDSAYTEPLCQVKYTALKTKIEENISCMITPHASSQNDPEPMILSDFVAFLEELDIDRRPIYWDQQLNQTWLSKMGDRIYYEVSIQLNTWLPENLHAAFKKRIRYEIDQEHFDLHHLTFDTIYVEYLEKTSWSVEEKEEHLKEMLSTQERIQQYYLKKYREYRKDQPNWLDSEKEHHARLKSYYEEHLKAQPLTNPLTRAQVGEIIHLIRQRGETLRYQESGYTQHTRDAFNLVYVRFAQKITLLMNYYFKEPRSIVSILYAVDNLECPNIAYLEGGSASPSWRPVLANLDIHSPFFEDFMQYYLYRIYLFDTTYYSVSGLFALNGTKLRMMRDEILLEEPHVIGSYFLKTRDVGQNNFRALHLYEWATLLDQYDLSVAHFVRNYFLKKWFDLRDRNASFIESSLKLLLQRYFHSTTVLQWLTHFREWCDQIVYEEENGVKRPRDLEQVYALYAVRVDDTFLFEYATAMIDCRNPVKQYRLYDIMETIAKLFLQKFRNEQNEEPMLARRRWFVQEYQTARGNVIPSGIYSLCFNKVKVITRQWQNLSGELEKIGIRLEDGQLSESQARALYHQPHTRLTPASFVLVSHAVYNYYAFLKLISSKKVLYSILPLAYFTSQAMKLSLRFLEIPKNARMKDNIQHHPFWSFKQSRYLSLYDYMAYYTIFSENFSYEDALDDLLQLLIDYDPDESKRIEYSEQHGDEKVKLYYQRSLKLMFAPEEAEIQEEQQTIMPSIKKTVSFHRHEDAAGGGGSASLMTP